MADVTSTGKLSVGGTYAWTSTPNVSSVGATEGKGTSPIVPTKFLSSTGGLGLKSVSPTGAASTGSLNVKGVSPVATERTVSTISNLSLRGTSPTAAIIGAVSAATASSILTFQKDILLTLSSTGQVTSSLTLDRHILLSVLSAATVTSTLTLMGVYQLALLSGASARSLQSLQTALGAELPDGAAVWVLNLDTSASAQYNNYGFNSFFRRGDDYFGVTNDGIYRLAGETDAGLPVDALAAFVRTSLGVPNVKRVPSVYVGATSDGALILRTEVEGAVRYYKARSYSSDLRQHRVDIGRGSRGTHWQFELLNENGNDFELADMTLLPTVMDRRI